MRLLAAITIQPHVKKKITARQLLPFPLMMDIIRDNAKSFMADLFGTGAFSTPDMCRFQALSYALMAIKSILAAYPNTQIENELRQWQQRDFKFLGMDGRDITDRLKRP